MKKRQATYAKSDKVKAYRTQYANRPASKAAKRRRRNTPEYRERVNANAYSMTVEEYRAFVAVGCCAICGTTDADFHIDHDHACCPKGRKSCGECVRGLLCRNCNLGLGHFDDDIDRLKAAITYLEGIA